MLSIRSKWKSPYDRTWHDVIQVESIYPIQERNWTSFPVCLILYYLFALLAVSAILLHPVSFPSKTVSFISSFQSQFIDQFDRKRNEVKLSIFHPSIPFVRSLRFVLYCVAVLQIIFINHHVINQASRKLNTKLFFIAVGDTKKSFLSSNSKQKRVWCGWSLPLLSPTCSSLLFLFVSGGI